MLSAARRRCDGLTIFCVHILQHLGVQGLIGDQPLQARVLVPQRLQLLHLVQIHRAILLLPAVERGFADVHAAADGFRRLPLFDPAQDRDDLLRRVLFSFGHVWFSFSCPGLSSATAQFS